MKKPGYTETDIRTQATSKSFERGMQYYLANAVRRIERRGDQVLARVEGSEYPPYRVRVILAKDAIEEARCNCPYDWEGWCKHIVAVLVFMLERPGRVAERATIESLVDDLDQAQLRELVLHLTERYPHLIAKIERWVESEGT